MIILSITIILLVGFFIFTSSMTAHYCFKALAHRLYTVGELTPEFKQHFSKELATCPLPCKRLISSSISFFFQGTDTRPIIYAAGEIYINEEICKPFSPEGFAAGLAYEVAHYETGFYIYSEVVMFILFAGCLPFFYWLNGLLQALISQGYQIMPLSAVAWVINVLCALPLLQFFIVTGGMICIELWFGSSVVNYYAAYGHDLKGLLRYLRYVESYITPALNQSFNITNNRKRCEKLLEENAE